MKQITVLVVEDEAIVAKDIENSLKQLGYKIVGVAATGQEAIDMARRMQPNIVLMDIVLKGPMDGIDAANVICGDLDIPLVYLTAYADDRTLARVKATSPYGYVVKPFEVRELNAVVQTALHRYDLEQEIEKSRYWLSTLLEALEEAVVGTEKEGNLTYLNRAAASLTGWDQSNAVGRPASEVVKLVAASTGQAIPHPVFAALQSRAEIPFGPDAVLVHRNGGKHVIEGIVKPLLHKGDICGTVMTSRDISERKRAHEEREKLQAQFLQAQKMESVGTLAGGIAHDFNNALTGIIGFGELLRIRMAGDDRSLHDLDEILRCAERASTLTRQLLAYARRQIIAPVNLNISTLIADMMKLIGKLVGEHIEARTYLEKNGPTIRADRGQIEQVVMNLCLNARDAMPGGGTLVVETEEVYLEEEYVRYNVDAKTGRYALLTVSDTGVGIDEKTRERVFDPFFTTKGPDKGTGLGLSVVYGIVKQHGGFIHLYSEPGKGTALKVYFPAIEAQPDAVPEKRGEEILHGGTETLLLAEDEESIRSLFVRVLKELGYNVLVARNGEEAIEIFKQNNEIALAILDAVMPRKGGNEAFEEMYKQNPRLKVIFMSGYSANGIHNSFVSIFNRPFLQKPFSAAILARKIREVLDTQ